MDHIALFFYFLCLVPGISITPFILIAIINKNGEFYKSFLIFIFSLTLFILSFILNQYGINSSTIIFVFPGFIYLIVGVSALSLLVVSAPLLVMQMCGEKVSFIRIFVIIFLSVLLIILNSFVLKSSSDIIKSLVVAFQITAVVMYMAIKLFINIKRGKKVIVAWIFNRVFYITLFFFPFLIFDYFIYKIAVLNEIFIYGIFAFPVYYLILTSSILYSFINNYTKQNLYNSELKISEKAIIKYSITKRELEVIEPLVQGASYIDIADKLFISLKTVKTHVYNIYKKTDVHNRLELLNLIRS